MRGIQRGDLKGHRTDCSNTSTHMLELCAWATEDVILHLSLATLRKRNNKLTDETLVNEGLDMYKLTDEFRMIPSVMLPSVLLPLSFHSASKVIHRTM